MSTNLQVVVGLGVTGLSCVRFLKQKGFNVAITDTRSAPPHLQALQAVFPDVPVFLGGINEALLAEATQIILSPGISLETPEISKRIQAGARVIGDIELFAQYVVGKTVAITGTNAKSTVTTLVGLMVQNAGLKVAVGGNLGEPALNLLSTQAEVYVLELSSFQLETTYSLKPTVATVLNVTPDHMDRYHHYEAYLAAKRRVYQNADVVVCNRDDPQTDYLHPSLKAKFSFTLQTPGANEFGLIKTNAGSFIAFEDQVLMNVNALPVAGKHYQANALAALAIGHGLGLSFDSMMHVLQTFGGLPHRCQLVRERHGVKWYNDSKGTNVGATGAAMIGIGSEIEGKLILIAGGLGKNADFSPLLPLMEQYARHVVLIGQAAPLLATLIEKKLPFTHAKDMVDAVEKAAKVSLPGDCVLLSPACASYDMFKNFEHRGEVFTAIVKDMKT